MISQFEQLHHEVTSPRKFLGFLLASLYFKGIDEIVVTKEQVEDDVWSAVELQAHTVYDDQTWHFKFKVRGFPKPRPTPKAEGASPVKPYPWKQFIIGAITGLLVHLFDRWWLL